MRFIKYGLTEVDMFGKPISLFFYGKTKYNSSIGGCLTLSMITLILVLSNSLLTSILYRKEVYLTTSDKIDMIPTKISFKNRFAIHIDPFSAYIPTANSKKYFDVLIGYGSWFLDSKGEYVLKTTYYNLTYCNESHFPIFTKQQFQNYGLGSFLCPEDPNLEIDLKGTYDFVNQYNFLEVSFRQCVQQNEQEICANSSEIEDLLKIPNGEIYFDVLIINNILDSGNYDKPFTPFVDKITNVIGLSTYKQLEVYLTPVTLLTDPNRSFSYFKDHIEMAATENFMYERKFDMFYNNAPRMDNDHKVYLSMYIQSSILSKIYQRRYDTFGDYCQTIGSLYSLFSLVFGILNKLIASNKLNLKIAKSLYNFKKIQELWAKSTTKRKSSLFVKSIPFKIKNFWGKFFENRKGKIIVDKVVTKELDLTQLLMKIKEIETLKKILFTKDQKIVFNYITKPHFRQELKISSKRDLIYNQKILKRTFLTFPSMTFHMDETNHRQKLITACKNLKNDENELNHRILKLLDMGNIDKKFKKIEKSQSQRLWSHFSTKKKLNKMNFSEKN